MHITNTFEMMDAHEMGLEQLKVIIEHGDGELPLLQINPNLQTRGLVYNESELAEATADGDEDEVLLVNDETIEKGYVFVASAYRGEGVYNAFLKVGGKWWDCDIVSEGCAYEVAITDEEVERLVNEYIAKGPADEEE